MSHSFEKNDQKSQCNKPNEFRTLAKGVLKVKQRHSAARTSVRSLFDRYVKPHHH